MIWTPHDFNRCHCDQWGRCLGHCATCHCGESGHWDWLSRRWVAALDAFEEGT